MANIVETVSYDSGVYLIATSDAVIGGTAGIANKAATNLANRTAYLKSQVDTINALTPTLAPLLSPTLTGTPKTAAPSVGDNSVQIATTAFVQITSKGRIAINVAGSANVTLTGVQAGYAFIEFTGALTGNITVTVPGSASTWIMKNSTSGAYTITLASATGSGSNMVLPQGGSQEILTDGTNVYGLGYLPVTGGTLAPSGSTAWVALNSPTLRVTDTLSGTGGGLSIESYQPTIQFIDKTTSAKNTRLLVDNGSIRFANDAGDGLGVYAAAGVAMHADGYMAVGGTNSLSANTVIAANGTVIGTGTSQYGINFSGEFNDSATSNGYAFYSSPKVKASAFTMSNLYGFIALAPSLGTGATVNNYNAFDVQDASGIAFIAGYRGKVSSGTGKWNLYLDGSASNYVAGRLLIGTTTDDASGLIQVAGDISSTTGKLQGTRYGNGGALVLRGAAGTLAAPTAVASGGQAGTVTYRAYDGANWQDVASVDAWVDANVTSANSSGYLSFFTTPSGAVAKAERMRLTSSGRLLIGTTTDDGSNLLQVAGNIAVTGNQTLTNTTNSTVGSISTSAYSGGLSIEAMNVGNTTKKNLALSPWGGRVLIGTTTDDGINVLQAAGQVKFGGLNVDNGTAFSTLYLANGGKNRWTIYKDNAAESGSNAGANFGINAVADDGSSQFQVLTINRATYQMQLNGGLQNNGTGLKAGLLMQNTTASTGRKWSLYSSDAGNLVLGDETAGIGRLVIGTGGLISLTGDVSMVSAGAYSYRTIFNAGSYAPFIRGDNTGSIQAINSANTNVNLTISDSGYLTARGGVVSQIGSGLATGAFRTTTDIGGAFADWNGNKTFAVQIDAPSWGSAYGGIRWTRWGGRHLAAIEAYEGNSGTAQPTIVLHVTNYQNAWTFSGTDITRGAGGYVYGSWNNYGSLGSNGYMRLASGWIIQWGLGTAGYGGGSVVNYYPTSFPNACFSVVANHVGTDASVNVITDANYLGNLSAFGVRSSYGGGNNVSVQWMAVGY